MSGSEQVQTPSQSTPSSAPAREPSLSSLIIPTVVQAVQSAASVILPSAPITGSEPAAAAPSAEALRTPQTAEPASAAPAKETGFFSWLADKTSAFFTAVGEHLGRLGEVRDLPGLADWAKNAASDLWEGVKSVSRDVAHTVSRFFGAEDHSHDAHYANAVEHHGLSGEITELLSESAEFTAEAIAKRREALEELYEHLRESTVGRHDTHGHPVETHLHNASHIAVRFTAHSIDPLTLGNLRLAILGNEIPPECMIEVRRLLAEVEAEKSRTAS